MRDDFLLTRKDKKYILHSDFIPKVVSQLAKEYQLMTVEEERYNKYSTVYLDTPDFKMYNKHHNGHLSRYKIRTRTYEVTDSSFLEWKTKNNKSITVKERTTLSKGVCLNCSIDDLISKGSGIDVDTLERKIKIDYVRLTFIGKKARITIDQNLVFSKDDGTVSLDNLGIIEFKFTDNSLWRKFNKIMLGLGIRSMGLSKYCIGISYLYDVKKNNFLSKLRRINSIVGRDHGFNPNVIIPLVKRNAASL